MPPARPAFTQSFWAAAQDVLKSSLSLAQGTFFVFSGCMTGGTVCTTWRLWLYRVLPGPAPPLTHQALGLCIVVLAVAPDISSVIDGSLVLLHFCRSFRKDIVVFPLLMADYIKSIQNGVLIPPSGSPGGVVHLIDL